MENEFLKSLTELIEQEKWTGIIREAELIANYDLGEVKKLSELLKD